MDDVLDQLAEPAVELSGRVDDVLAAAGAPAGHRIWPLLRRLRVLPGDAVQAVIELRPGAMAGAEQVTGDLRRAYEEVRATLAEGGSWQGPAAEAYAAHRSALTEHVAGLTGRVDATAAYAEAVAYWIADTRRALARTVGDVLGSAEAVAVVTAARAGVGPSVVPAAAEIGARILATVAEAYDRAEVLPQRWVAELEVLAHRPPDAPAMGPGGGRIVL
ncbi:hypothetical protein ACN28C_07870 [Plantactinospora sp. WMMC1484]|uniref:hypothetical protein n=1 Tax=Plantactinospora sp. WMMC1484 TaxID=3404122 RepID=UPI003BF5D29C